MYEPTEDKDTLVMRYVNDQFKNLNLSHKEPLFNNQQKVVSGTDILTIFEKST